MRANLLGLAKILLHAGWACLLLFLVMTSHIVLSGLVSSGALAMVYGQVLFMLAALPIALLTPLALHLHFGRALARAGGFGLLAVTLWWVFWLPASLQDIAYTQRYHIPDPYVWPATASSQVIVISAAVWLLTAERLTSWLSAALRLFAYGIASVACANIGTPLADWAMQDFSLWLLLPCASLAFIPQFIKTPPRLAPKAWHEGRIFLATQSTLAMLWILVYRFGSALPDSINAFGAAIIYR